MTAGTLFDLQPVGPSFHPGDRVRALVGESVLGPKWAGTVTCAGPGAKDAIGVQWEAVDGDHAAGLGFVRSTEIEPA